MMCIAFSITVTDGFLTAQKFKHCIRHLKFMCKDQKNRTDLFLF